MQHHKPYARQINTLMAEETKIVIVSTQPLKVQTNNEAKQETKYNVALSLIFKNALRETQS